LDVVCGGGAVPLGLHVTLSLCSIGLRWTPFDSVCRWLRPRGAVETQLLVIVRTAEVNGPLRYRCSSCCSSRSSRSSRIASSPLIRFPLLTGVAQTVEATKRMAVGGQTVASSLGRPTPAIHSCVCDALGCHKALALVRRRASCRRRSLLAAQDYRTKANDPPFISVTDISACCPPATASTTTATVYSPNNTAARCTQGIHAVQQTTNSNTRHRASRTADRQHQNDQ
jgi:hypothetical protein